MKILVKYDCKINLYLINYCLIWFCMFFFMFGFLILWIFFLMDISVFERGMEKEFKYDDFILKICILFLEIIVVIL